MQLSNSGRVVIVDDDRREVWPLIETLSKKRIPYVYFDGSLDKLPETQFDGVRFVFLDVELQGMEGQDSKTKASALTGVLGRIVSGSNGPYIIVFWTKHSEVIECVVDNCHRAGIPPVAWIDMDKSECMGADENARIELIYSKLTEKLATVGAFKLYVAWENIVNAACSEFVLTMSALGPTGDASKWSDYTSALFWELYKSYVEKNEVSNSEEQFQCACLLINRCFLDTLQQVVSRGLVMPDGFELKSGQIDMDTRAKLNRSLFLSNSLLPRCSTGHVYLEEREDLRDALKKGLFKEGKCPDGVQLCKVIITPECDLAQGKTLRIQCAPDDHKMHRVVYGLMFPHVDDINNRRRSSDAQFPIEVFWHDGKAHRIILHFSTVTFQHEGELSGECLFSLRRDLMFDIQSKAANHVNRLGNFQL